MTRLSINTLSVYVFGNESVEERDYSSPLQQSMALIKTQ